MIVLAAGGHLIKIRPEDARAGISGRRMTLLMEGIETALRGARSAGAGLGAGMPGGTVPMVLD